MNDEKEKKYSEEDLDKTFIMPLSKLSTTVEGVRVKDTKKKNVDIKKTSEKVVTLEKLKQEDAIVEEVKVVNNTISEPVEQKILAPIEEHLDVEDDLKKEKVSDEVEKIEEVQVIEDKKEHTKEEIEDKEELQNEEVSVQVEKIEDVQVIEDKNEHTKEETEDKEVLQNKKVSDEVEKTEDVQVIEDKKDHTTEETEDKEKLQNEEVSDEVEKAEDVQVIEDKNEETKEDTKVTNDEVPLKSSEEIEPVKELEPLHDETKMTLEEKRSKERSTRMTIEQRRDLQQQGKLPTTPEKKHFLSDNMDKVSFAILIFSMLMSWFITYRIAVYFTWVYALVFFLVTHAILAGIFFLSMKKRKIGLGVNIVACILIFILSLVAYRVSGVTNQVFDNSESELVMLVAKKDATITEKDDFKDKKIAFIKSDGDTNTFAKEMLAEAKKDNYKDAVYATYKEAYEALKSGDVDMMVYTTFTKQRLAEDEIQSWDEVKVVMQKSRMLKAVVAKEVDISKDPFNIYISGVDLTSYSINEKGSSDVNIIMSINPQTKKIIMQTIPRDTWAPLSCANGERTKLTYAGAYGGIDCSIKTLEEYLDIEINYYAKINFQGVIDLVDALGGITVNSNASFCESHPVDGYGTQNYCYNAGANTLDGIDALMFARIRKVFSDGDIERGRHQMEVVNAVIREFSESPSLTSINALLGAVENNFTTNLNKDDIGKGIDLFLGMQDSLSNISTTTMEGELVWDTDEVTEEYLYYFIPNEGQVELVKQRIQDVLDGK